MTAVLVEVHDVWKIYRLGKVDVPAVQGITLQVRRGEFVSLVGPSGCGKTTLLNLLSGLDQPTRGQVTLDGVNLAEASKQEVLDIRRHKIGFIFQSFHLIPTLTALENVILPLRYARVERKKWPTRASSALAQVGLSERQHHRPTELSGGEQQRVAIARAIVHDPLLVLADEPTGELDSANSQAIMELLLQFNREQGKTFVIVTHDREVAAAAKRVIALRDGIVEEDRCQVAKPVL